MASEETRIEPRHLGDGVYVGFDGYQITIAANHHENVVAYLEPRVLQGLLEYAREIDKKHGVKHFGV